MSSRKFANFFSIPLPFRKDKKRTVSEPFVVSKELFNKSSEEYYNNERHRKVRKSVSLERKRKRKNQNHKQKVITKNSNTIATESTPFYSMSPCFEHSTESRPFLTAKDSDDEGDVAVSDSSQSLTHTMTLDQFKILNPIGDGTFGRVYRCVNVNTKKYYAIKKIKKVVVIALQQLDHLKNEVTIMKNLDNPFIVKMYQTFVDERFIYLLMEYVYGGELFQLLRTAGRLNLQLTRFYAAELVLVVQYLHDHDIIYRDLKPENILLDDVGHLKLCDFGFAKVVTNRTWTMCGTPEYIAPEIILGRGHDKAVDWWSLGVLIYEMHAGYPPFVGDSPFELYEKICEGKYKCPAHFTTDITDLISRLLQTAPSKRLGNFIRGALDVKNHSFFDEISFDDLLNKKINPPVHPSSYNYKPASFSISDSSSSEDETEESVPANYGSIFAAYG